MTSIFLVIQTVSSRNVWRWNFNQSINQVSSNLGINFSIKKKSKRWSRENKSIAEFVAFVFFCLFLKFINLFLQAIWFNLPFQTVLFWVLISVQNTAFISSSTITIFVCMVSSIFMMIGIITFPSLDFEFKLESSAKSRIWSIIGAETVLFSISVYISNQRAREWTKHTTIKHGSELNWELDMNPFTKLSKHNMLLRSPVYTRLYILINLVKIKHNILKLISYDHGIKFKKISKYNMILIWPYFGKFSRVKA